MHVGCGALLAFGCHWVSWTLSPTDTVSLHVHGSQAVPVFSFTKVFRLFLNVVKEEKAPALRQYSDFQRCATLAGV